ncbi:MAG: pectinesterase family protein [Bacteroidota bacterium]
MKKRVSLLFFLGMALLMTVQGLATESAQNSSGLARPTATISWDQSLEPSPDWYGTYEAKRIGDNILLYQRDSGGWPKNIDMAKVLLKEEIPTIFKDKAKTDAAIDNGATIYQLRFLARVYNATLIDRYQDGFVKGIDFLLGMKQGNEDVLQFLREIKSSRSDYGFLDKTHLAKVGLIIKKGFGYQAPTKSVAVDKLKKKKEYDFIVAQDGSGDYNTVQAAIDAVPKNNNKKVTIFIRNGIYKEKIQLRKDLISLIGEDRKRTVLTYNDFALKIGPYGSPLRTSGTPSIFIYGKDISVENLTIENSSGCGTIYEQAVAVDASGDRLVFRNCSILGYQDTLFTGGVGRQYYENCYIKGDVDFIFGSATAVFNECKLYSINRGQEPNGYLTAASTTPMQKYGYVFIKCDLETGAVAQHSVFLGRPWAGFAAVAFIECHMGAHIKAEGWHNWNKPKYESTARFVEYRSSGPGGSMEKRVKWAKQLTAEEAKEYTVEKVLAGEDGWNPKKL